ncbi:MAG: hypothetical protein HQ475_08275 [SAR202 cluster bacterium]|nr:hypothetical protein [SAR202 cluster bacterium]
MSNLITNTAEQEAALQECLLAASLAGGQTSEARALACLTEKLGAEVAKVVASGLLPLSDEESAILGECVLSAITSSASSIVKSDPIVTCLEKTLDSNLAKAVASKAIPLTAEQESLLAGCEFSTSLGGGNSSTLSDSVITCLENSLGAESAQAVASGATNLTDKQQAALGGCKLGSALGTSSSTVSTGIMDCLTKELGADVAQVVASAVLPLSAAEEQVMGNCVLLDALGIAP